MGLRVFILGFMGFQSAEGVFFTFQGLVAKGLHCFSGSSLGFMATGQIL